jgi:hypothetical protein
MATATVQNSLVSSIILLFLLTNYYSDLVAYAKYFNIFVNVRYRSALQSSRDHHFGGDKARAPASHPVLARLYKGYKCKKSFFDIPCVDPVAKIVVVGRSCPSSSASLASDALPLL